MVEKEENHPTKGLQTKKERKTSGNHKSAQTVTLQKKLIQKICIICSNQRAEKGSLALPIMLTGAMEGILEEALQSNLSPERGKDPTLLHLQIPKSPLPPLSK